jgi:hypothetical protein
MSSSSASCTWKVYRARNVCTFGGILGLGKTNTIIRSALKPWCISRKCARTNGKTWGAQVSHEQTLKDPIGGRTENCGHIEMEYGDREARVSRRAAERRP